MRIKCRKCNNNMMSLGTEKVNFGKDYKGKVKTFGCVEDGSCMFVPVPKQSYFFWSEAEVKGRGKNARTVVGRFTKIGIRTSWYKI